MFKQEVSFEEAKTVLDDPLYVRFMIDFYDPNHSEDEEQYFIGSSP